MTGAGVSAASGVPTFRGADGLWKHFRVEELATPDAFARDPGLVWEWYDWRRQLIGACEPNAAHHVLADWSLRFPQFALITQNVDGLHERAGTARVLRLHGSIWDVGCWRNCAASPHRWRDHTTPFPVLPPPCPHCGGPLRPGVVWFGETLDAEVMDASLAATDCDVFFTVGTSSVVYPAAGLVDYARRGGALTVEINPDSTPASGGVDVAVAPTGGTGAAGSGPAAGSASACAADFAAVAAARPAAGHGGAAPAMDRTRCAALPVGRRGHSGGDRGIGHQRQRERLRHAPLRPLVPVHPRRRAETRGILRAALGGHRRGSRAALRPSAGLLAAGARPRGRASGGGCTASTLSGFHESSRRPMRPTSDPRAR